MIKHVICSRDIIRYVYLWCDIFNYVDFLRNIFKYVDFLRNLFKYVDFYVISSNTINSHKKNFQIQSQRFLAYSEIKTMY